MVSILRMTVIALSVLSLNAFAKKTPADCKTPSELENQVEAILEVAGSLPAGGCADSSKLVGICDAIYLKWDGPKGTEYDYMYEKMIHDASCVKPNESEEIIAKKVQGMWNKLENPYLKCNQANFDVPRGSVLKYALKMRNYDFIGLAVEVWKVNINSVDKNDGKTLLDYVQGEIERVQGSEYEGRLKGYYKFLKENGARHSRDLL